MPPHQRSDPSHQDQTIDGQEEADQHFPDEIGILHSRNKFP